MDGGTFESGEYSGFQGYPVDAFGNPLTTADAGFNPPVDEFGNPIMPDYGGGYNNFYGYDTGASDGTAVYGTFDSSFYNQTKVVDNVPFNMGGGYADGMPASSDMFSEENIINASNGSGDNFNLAEPGHNEYQTDVGQMSSSSPQVDEEPLEEQTVVKDKNIVLPVRKNISAGAKFVRRIILASILLMFLSFGIVFNVSASFYPNFFGYRFIGVGGDKDNYINGKFAELIIVKVASEYDDVKVGDKVCFKIGSRTIMREVQEVDMYNELGITTKNSEFILRIENIIGVVESRIPVIGIVIVFINSYVGISVFALGFIAVITFGLIRRYKDYENEKAIADLITEAEDKEILNIFNNDDSKTFENITQYQKEKRSTSFVKSYNNISGEVFAILEGKESFSDDQKRSFTNMLEIIGRVNSITAAMRDSFLKYISLGLVYEFNAAIFAKYSIEFLNKNIKKSDLMNLGRIIYAVAIKVTDIKPIDMSNLMMQFKDKAMVLLVHKTEEFKELFENIMMVLKLPY